MAYPVAPTNIRHRFACCPSGLGLLQFGDMLRIGSRISDGGGTNEAAPKRLPCSWSQIDTQLEQVGKAIAVVGHGGSGSVLKGRMVPPKYRGPSGETWAGRGAKPRWLVAAIQRGK